MLLHELPLEALPHRAVRLSEDVVLLTIPEGTGSELAHLPGTRPPFGTVEISTAAGTQRVAAMRLGAAQAWLNASPTWHRFEPDGFRGELSELTEELDTSSCRRLLAFLLGFCRKAFDLANDVEFASACLRLAQLCAGSSQTAEPIATVGAKWVVLEGMQVSRDATIFIMSANRVRQSAAPRLEGVFGLHLVERITAGEVLLALCDYPVLWTVGRANAARRELLDPRADARDPLRISCLRALAPVCPATAAIAREVALLTPASARKHDDVARPIGAALEAALPDGEGRLFLRGWLRDPEHLVASAEICTFAGNVELEISELHRFRRPELAGHYATAVFSDTEPRIGFVAHVTDPSAGLCAQATLSLRLHSGSTISVTPTLRRPTAASARGAVLTSVPLHEVTPAMLDQCLAPAAAAFHRQALAQRSEPERVQIGPPVSKPTISVIVPLYRNLSFLRFQIAALASDKEFRQAELIIVLDSPEQRAEAEHLLRGLYALHGLPVTLLAMTVNLGYAAANNVGAAQARAATLLLLNSDVLPVRPGWLGPLRAELARPGVGAVGPKLLFDDESIQHAGLFFERHSDGMWLNAHYDKGMPRDWPASQRRRVVPGVTGACLMVRRSLFDQVGGICEDYIIGDYEDSDFCLRLYDAGAAIVYVPAAELFHFERRSIALHSGYTGTLASHYNRRLQHRRWDAAICALMAEPSRKRVGRRVA